MMGSLFQSEYDDNRTDPYHGEEDKNDEPENMDLPDDLNLDQDEPGEEDDGGIVSLNVCEIWYHGTGKKKSMHAPPFLS